MPTVLLDDKGLAPAICQHADTGEVIMLGYVSPGALKRTLEGGEVWFYSRSRSDLWHKGEVSGNYMRIRSAAVDCDGDVVLLKVIPDGPICHTGNPTCFFTPMDDMPEFDAPQKGPGILEELYSVIQDRKREMPAGSYTTSLFEGGADRIAQKVIEESGEAAIAAVKRDSDGVAAEMADLFYHALALMSASGVRPEAVWDELRRRRG